MRLRCLSLWQSDPIPHLPPDPISHLIEPTRPTNPPIPTITHPQALPATSSLRYTSGSPQHSKSALRRTTQSYGWAQSERGISRGVTEDAFAPTRPPFPPPDPVHGLGRTLSLRGRDAESL